MAWRKSWSQQNLEPDGTKRQLAPEHRSVWDDLLDLAENAHDGGTVAAFPHVGFTIEQFSEIFKTPAPIVAKALERFKALDMIGMNGTGVIVIKKWNLYQSDYDRVKEWREAKKRA